MVLTPMSTSVGSGRAFFCDSKILRSCGMTTTKRMPVTTVAITIINIG